MFSNANENPGSHAVWHRVSVQVSKFGVTVVHIVARYWDLLTYDALPMNTEYITSMNVSGAVNTRHPSSDASTAGLDIVENVDALFAAAVSVTRESDKIVNDIPQSPLDVMDTVQSLSDRGGA